jgi:small subunit ribosomal protein S8
MLTDPIADMLTRIRNAARVAHVEVDIPASKLKAAVAEVLKTEGYITDYAEAGEGVSKVIRIALKYMGGESVIAGLTRVSRPAQRVYVGAGEIPRVRGGFGTVILSTPSGVVSGKEAKKKNVGGEVLCVVW